MRGRFSFVLPAALAVALVASCAQGPSGPPASQGDLTATVQSEQVTVFRGQPLSMRLELKNASQKRLMVLAYQTPFAGLEADLFEVTRDGLPVQYTGKLVKRPAPQADDYLAIEPGQALAGAFDPSEAYDMSKPGHYEVRYRAPALEVVAPDETDRLRKVSVRDVSSNAFGLWFDGIREQKAKPPSGGQFARCSAEQQADLVLARTNAHALSVESASYLETHFSAPSSERYATWFGARLAPDNRDRWTTVASNFTAIENAFADPAQISYDCGCKKAYYAFVMPNQPYKITLCRAFWAAPPTGTDSKAGTLIHEMSHFTVVAGTNDYAYGQVNVKALALDNPDRAVLNADSNEYFAENTPALP